MDAREVGRGQPKIFRVREAEFDIPLIRSLFLFSPDSLSTLPIFAATWYAVFGRKPRLQPTDP